MRSEPPTPETAMSDEQCYWNWEAAIVDACSPSDQWMALKFVTKLKEHGVRYPAFKAGRVAQKFIDANPRVRAAYCYQPMTAFTKAIHKSASLRSQARNES